MATGWSTTQKGANVTISGTNNVTATFGSGTQAAAIERCSNAEKIYIEIVMTTMPSTGRVGIGLLHREGSMSYTTVLGSDTMYLGYDSAGAVKINNSTLSTIMTYAAADNIGMAIDSVSQKVWFRKNGGNWNNDIITNQNPVGAVGGISYATMTLAGRGVPSPYSVWAQLTFTTSAVATSKVDAASWTYTAPTGFTSLDAAFAGSAVVVPKILTGMDNPIYTLSAGNSAVLPPQIQKIGLGKEANRGGVIFSPASTKGISGTLKVEGVAAIRKVRVYDQATGEFLGETWSDGSGNWSLPGFSKAKVVVVALDNDDSHNAARYVGVVPGP